MAFCCDTADDQPKTDHAPDGLCDASPSGLWQGPDYEGAKDKGYARQHPKDEMNVCPCYHARGLESDEEDDEEDTAADTQAGHDAHTAGPEGGAELCVLRDKN